jgi:hypothetical protein
MTRPYLVTRCLRNGAPYRPHPYPIGIVEIKGTEWDMPVEKQAIRQSRSAYKEGEEDIASVRASIIIEASDVLEAFALAEARIDEALDVLTAINPSRGMSSYKLLETGCIRDLINGQISPRLPSSTFGPFTAYLIEPNAYPPRDLAQFVLSAESELGGRYIRAAHWSRKAEFESNAHLAMLFEWFAAESIWSLKSDDDMLPSIRWSLGFKNGKGAQQLSDATTTALANEPDYRSWSRHIEGLLQRIRTIRNQTVHNGFRLIDIPLAELRLIGKLARLVARGAQSTAAKAIVDDIVTAREMVEYLPLVLEDRLVATSRNVVQLMKDAGARL